MVESISLVIQYPQLLFKNPKFHFWNNLFLMINVGSLLHFTECIIFQIYSRIVNSLL